MASFFVRGGLVEKAINKVPRFGFNLTQWLIDSLGELGYRKTLKGSKVHDFPSIAADSQSTTTITVPGAAVEDTVTVGSSTAFAAGLIAYARVTAANTVTYYVQNTSAGALDPASRTLYVTVHK